MKPHVICISSSGDTYQSGIGLDDVQPSLEQISLPHMSNHLIFFDLETTGLGKDLSSMNSLLSDMFQLIACNC